MLVTVVEIRVMRMPVPNPQVAVPVAVGLSVRIGPRMVVLVMDIVLVAMLILIRPGSCCHLVEADTICAAERYLSSGSGHT